MALEMLGAFKAPRTASAGKYLSILLLISKCGKG